jgi:hypothetical protein
MAVQLGYENHSKNFFQNQDREEKLWEMQAAKAEKNKDLPEEHHDTIDQGELYNGMAIQLAWDEIETHSPNWWKIQDEQEAEYAADEQKEVDDSKKLAIEMMGMTAEQQAIA